MPILVCKNHAEKKTKRSSWSGCLSVHHVVFKKYECALFKINGWYPFGFLKCGDFKKTFECHPFTPSWRCQGIDAFASYILGLGAKPHLTHTVLFNSVQFSWPVELPHCFNSKWFWQSLWGLLPHLELKCKCQSVIGNVYMLERENVFSCMLIKAKIC